MASLKRTSRLVRRSVSRILNTCSSSGGRNGFGALSMSIVPPPRLPREPREPAVPPRRCTAARKATLREHRTSPPSAHNAHAPVAQPLLQQLPNKEQAASSQHSSRPQTQLAVTLAGSTDLQTNSQKHQLCPSIITIHHHRIIIPTRYVEH